MDNSPKFRSKAIADGYGPIWKIAKDAVFDRRLQKIAWKSAQIKRLQAAGSKRKAELRAAIRRLNYKRDEAKGNG